MHQIIEMNCPGCGARVNTGQKECDWCSKPIIVSTFNSVYSMSLQDVNKYANAYRKVLVEAPDDINLNKSIAMCYLRLNMVDRAYSAFEKAIESNFDDSESYFYAAVCLLGGKKAFLNPRANIDKALEFLDAALMIEPKGIYYYFIAYIKYDYFDRKSFKTSPNYQDYLQMSIDSGLSDYDVNQLFTILNVARPKVL